jgi:hypothetical protein
MREYAELALSSCFPPGGGAGRLRAHFISHMPATHLAHAYSDAYQTRTGIFGVKVFFYRAQLISGGVGDDATVADYTWAREGELPSLLSAETYDAVRPALFGVGNDLSHVKVAYEEGDDAAQW